MKLFLFKIKKGMLNKWLDWGNLLKTTYKEEAIETLKEEGLTYESFFVFKVDEDYYTVAILDGEAGPANLERELNQKHKAMKNMCLEKIGSLDEVYELLNK